MPITAAIPRPGPAIRRKWQQWPSGPAANPRTCPTRWRCTASRARKNRHLPLGSAVAPMARRQQRSTTRQSPMPALDIRDLGVRYATKEGPVEALSGINLSMSDGDFVVAIGASGCGKTTLLSCIAGFLPPTRGSLALHGKPIAGPGADRGVVFQKHALMPWLSVVQNVEFGPRMRGMPPQERRSLAMEKLALVGLESF